MTADRLYANDTAIVQNLDGTRYDGGKDTLGAARQLIEAGVPRPQAEAIAVVAHQATEGLVTGDQLAAELRSLELRLVKWMIGVGLGVAGVVLAGLVMVVRLLS